MIRLPRGTAASGAGIASTPGTWCRRLTPVFGGTRRFHRAELPLRRIVSQYPAGFDLVSPPVELQGTGSQARGYAGMRAEVFQPGMVMAACRISVTAAVPVKLYGR